MGTIECCIFINKITDCLTLQKNELIIAFITKCNDDYYRILSHILVRDRQKWKNLDLHKTVLVVGFHFLSDSSHFAIHLYLAIYCNHIFVSVQWYFLPLWGSVQHCPSCIIETTTAILSFNNINITWNRVR